MFIPPQAGLVKSQPHAHRPFPVGKVGMGAERSEAKAPQPHFHFNENAPTVDLGEKAEG